MCLAVGIYVPVSANRTRGEGQRQRQRDSAVRELSEIQSLNRE
jgi:hypothetical protein